MIGFVRCTVYSQDCEWCRLPVPRPGQVLGLVGTNGIGKSTALKVLAGKLKPNLGRFLVSVVLSIYCLSIVVALAGTGNVACCGAGSLASF